MIAQTGGPGVLIVRVTEGVWRVNVSITRPDGKSKQLDFENDATGERLNKSGQGYQKAFAGLYQQGYSLQSTFSATARQNDDRTTLVFVNGQ